MASGPGLSLPPTVDIPTREYRVVDGESSAPRVIRFDQPEAFCNNEGVIPYIGRFTEKLAHTFTLEELFVCGSPLGSVGVATALISGVIVIGLADGHHTYLSHFNDGVRDF